MDPEPVKALKEHVGGRVTVGVTLLQDRATVEGLKPEAPVTVTVDVAEPPGETVPGVSGEAEIVKSPTFSVIVVEWVREPEIPLTVTL